jgi:hypothetical protein
MHEHLIKVFQTSSVVALNQLFEHFNRERKLAILLNSNIAIVVFNQGLAVN